MSGATPKGSIPLKIKRTQFSPWSSGVMGSNSKTTRASTPAFTSTASTAKAASKGTEPTRVVSDIVAPVPTVVGAAPSKPAASGLAAHPKILNAQTEWERNRSLGGSGAKQHGLVPNRANSSGQVATKEAKRPAQDGDSNASKKHKTSRTPLHSTTFSSVASSTNTKITTNQVRAPQSASMPSPNLESSSQSKTFNYGHNSGSSKNRTSLPSKTSPSSSESSNNSHNSTTKAGRTPLHKRTPSSGFSSKNGMGLVRAEATRTPSLFTTPPLSSLPSTQDGFNSVRAEVRVFAERATEKKMDELKNRQEPQKLGETREPSFTPSNETWDLIDEDEFSQAVTVAQKERKDGPTIAQKRDSPIATSGPNKGNGIVALDLASSDRHYTMYQGPDGQRIPSRGIMFPANYKLHDDPNLSFVCPVRECRRLFKNIASLSGHWGAGHCGRAYNDNGDGTLSFVCDYANRGPGGSPGIVISRNPLPHDAPPPATPSPSNWGNPKGNQALNKGPKHKWTVGRSGGSNSRTVTFSRTPKEPSTPQTPPLPKVMTDVRSYLDSLLKPDQRTYKRDDARQMTQLPRKRDLPASWIAFHKGNDLDATVYTCAIAYMTGDEITGPDVCMAHSRLNAGASARLSATCIGLPPALTRRAKRLFSALPTCVGCKYYSHLERQKSMCDWTLAAARDEAKDLAVSENSEGLGLTTTVLQSAESEDVNINSPIVISETDLTSEPGSPDPETRTRSPEDDDTTLGLRRPKRKVAVPASYAPPSRLKKIARTTSEFESTTNETSRSTGASQTVPEVQMAQATQVSNQLERFPLEMEDWEVAPGRMVDQSSQNVAFSNSYLTSGQPVTVSEDVSFNVLIIKPGSWASWDAEENKLRTVSVAVGKIKVHLGDVTFQLGPNGMFVLRPGKSCKVENRLYIDSVVHCTTSAGF